MAARPRAGRESCQRPRVLQGAASAFGCRDAGVTAINASIQGLLGLLQLGQRARSAAGMEELGFIAVNETRAMLAYRQAALWLDGDARRVAALSGVPRVDPGTPYVQWLARLF